MRLKTLLEGFKQITVKGSFNPEITGLSSLSKSLRPKELYIAFCGKTFDGRDFIPEAIQAKASGVITDIFNPLLDKKFVQIITKDPLALGQELALKFYKKVDYLIAVTGTNGKTTSAFCVQQLLNAIGVSCGLVGTCYVDTIQSISQSSLTTPDGISLSKLIHQSVQSGAKALVTEVSSHALAQKRIYGHKFDTVIFTNLTHDHLDYHQTFEAYGQAKLELFKKEYLKEKGYAVINLDDPFSKNIIDKTLAEVLTYSLENPKADFYLENLQLSLDGMRGLLHFQGKTYPFETGLIGKFNASNILASVASAWIYHKDIECLIKACQDLKPAPGRLEKISSNIYIDYAHTPDGLSSVLHALKKLPFKKVRLVFGCGGDRDKEKRPLMGKLAATLADELIITSDNPRHEDPNLIIEEIISGIKEKNFIKIIDRKQAIFEACQNLESDTLLLIAGKGHEKTQIIGHQTLPFDEVEIVREFTS
jgi:UDP-N-acetylmuramoyl-L-alanyl-D-glutamate--2,6-diaminopimelate ligase